jgi:hypothetical protein
MLKKWGVLFVECLSLLALGTMLIITFTGGFSVAIGSWSVKAHSIKNPLMILIIALILRTILVTSIFDPALWLTLIRHLVASLYPISDTLNRRLFESQRLKMLMLICQLAFGVIVVLVAVTNPMKPGLMSQYYANVDHSGTPIKTVRDRVINLRFRRQNLPALTISYSIQWTGVIFIPAAGEYTFTTLSDDGSELLIRDQRIVDNRGMHGLTPKSGTVHLAKGFQPITIKYTQISGSDGFLAYWTPPGRQRELLSHAFLFVNQPKQFGHVWGWAYQFMLPALLVLWGIGVLTFSLGISGYIARKLPIGRIGFQVIMLLLVAFLATRILSILQDRPYQVYFALRYVLSLCMVSLGVILLIGVGRALLRKPPTSVTSTGSGTGTARHEILVVTLLFGIFLLIGVRMVADYGISFDEKSNRAYGMATWQYMRNGDRQLFQMVEKYHGPVFEILLILLEKGLRLSDPHDIYLLRHFVTFLFFYFSVFVFYLLCKIRFGDWRIALLGPVFMVLSPRILADSFYNSKDLPFFSCFLIAIYTLVKFLEHKTWRRALLHALCCGILIDIRILGILVPGFTGLFILSELFLSVQARSNWKRYLVLLGFYSLFLIGFTLLFFPILWEAPVYHFMQAFLEMKRYPWGGGVIYAGEHINATRIPWHYIPTWIIITTPLLYVVTFIVGLFGLAKSLFGKTINLYSNSKHRLDSICVLWIFMPILSVIVLKSVVYDGWRHLFYVYPALLMIASNGLRSAFQDMLSLCKEQKHAQLVKTLLILVACLSLCSPTYFMITYHPHQNVYFNRLAGKDMQTVKANFDLDYWGLSYRQAFEYILKHDSREQIKIATANMSVEAIALILPPAQRKRIIPTWPLVEADYFASNFHPIITDPPYGQEIYAIKIGNAKIMAVYDIRAESEKEKIRQALK